MMALAPHSSTTDRLGNPTVPNGPCTWKLLHLLPFWSPTPLFFQSLLGDPSGLPGPPW